MTLVATKRTRSDGVRKMIRTLQTMDRDNLGRIKIGTFTKTFNEPVSHSTPSFWTFWFQGCEEVSVYVSFDPVSQELRLDGRGRTLDYMRMEKLPDGREFPVPDWSEVNVHFVHIDDIVEHRLKQPLMMALGLNTKLGRKT